MDTEVGWASPLVRVMCYTTDADFSALVGSGRCYVKLMNSAGMSVAKSCKASITGDACELSFPIPNAMLSGHDLTVRYGLDSSYEYTLEHHVSTHPAVTLGEARYRSATSTVEAVPIENNFVAILPPQLLFPTETFKIKIVAHVIFQISSPAP